jgi:hypothetical protein
VDCGDVRHQCVGEVGGGERDGEFAEHDEELELGLEITSPRLITETYLRALRVMSRAPSAPAEQNDLPVMLICVYAHAFQHEIGDFITLRAVGTL